MIMTIRIELIEVLNYYGKAGILETRSHTSSAVCTMLEIVLMMPIAIYIIPYTSQPA